MLSRGHANPRRGISESSRRGWGPSAIERKSVRKVQFQVRNALERIRIVRFRRTEAERSIQGLSGFHRLQRIQHHSPVAESRRLLDDRDRELPADIAAAGRRYHIHPLHLAHLVVSTADADTSDYLSVVAGEQQPCPGRTVHRRKLIELSREILKTEVHTQRGCVLLEETPSRCEFQLGSSVDD